jgi:hypothetical protein
VTFIIDGYNLMHAVGSAPPPKATPAAFDAARKRFLDWLADSPPIKADPSAVRVVFDAQNSKRDFGSTSHRGLTVTFSFRQTADDLIEALINVHPNPQSLRVVSNDSRLRVFARRHKCKPTSCGEFVDWLLLPVKADPPGELPKPDDKPPPDWPDEMETLMKAFG